jgi:hypothetical protein
VDIFQDPVSISSNVENLVQTSLGVVGDESSDSQQILDDLSQRFEANCVNARDCISLVPDICSQNTLVSPLPGGSSESGVALEAGAQGPTQQCHLCGKYYKSVNKHIVGAHPDAYRQRLVEKHTPAPVINSSGPSTPVVPNLF